MSGALTGLSVVASLVAVGWALARTGVLGASGQHVLARLVFFVGTPALLLRTLSGADVGALLSGQLVVAASGVAACVLGWVVLARWVFRLTRGEVVIGALGASYVNAANIGLPVAAYVVGDLTAVVPAMLLQMVVLTPLVLGVLDVSRHAGGPWWRRALSPLANPVLLAGAAGLALSATGTALPTALAEPVGLLAGLAVPGALIAFGMSLRGIDARGWSAPAVLTAAALKSLLMPLVAWLVARFALGMDERAVFAAVVVAALPSAQNVFTYAVRYDVARDLARDVVLVSTVATVPVLVLVGALLPH